MTKIKPRGRIPAEELQVTKDKITELYTKGTSLTDICKTLKTSHFLITKVVKERNLVREVEPEYGKCVNRDYFDNIDTEAKAYFLGFLIADGTMNGQNRISIALEQTDGYILEQFAKQLGMSSREVITLNCPSKVNTNSNPQRNLSFCSKRMRRALLNYGLVPNKVKKTFLPQLSEHLMPHLIRGLFDGDGHISAYSAYVSGTEKLCSQISNYLHLCGIETYIYLQKDTDVYYVKGKNEIGRRKFLDFIYTNSSSEYRLSRKYLAYTYYYLQAPLDEKSLEQIAEKAVDPETDLNTCIQCGSIKTFKSFPRKRGMKTGYSNMCLECNRSYQRSLKSRERDLKAGETPVMDND